MEKISSRYLKSSITITETMTLDDSNADTGPAHIVTNQSMLTIDNSVTLTVGDNKVLIPDAYNIFG